MRRLLLKKVFAPPPELGLFQVILSENVFTPFFRKSLHPFFRKKSSPLFSESLCRFFLKVFALFFEKSSPLFFEKVFAPFFENPSLLFSLTKIPSSQAQSRNLIPRFIFWVSYVGPAKFTSVWKISFLQLK